MTKLVILALCEASRLVLQPFTFYMFIPKAGCKLCDEELSMRPPFRTPYIQSSAQDIASPAANRFDELCEALKPLKATARVVGMTHDDIHIEIDAPEEHKVAAALLLLKYFPPNP
jgi:hypothetical protein